MDEKKKEGITYSKWFWMIIIFLMIIFSIIGWYNNRNWTDWSDNPECSRWSAYEPLTERGVIKFSCGGQVLFNCTTISNQHNSVIESCFCGDLASMNKSYRICSAQQRTRELKNWEGTFLNG